MKRLAVLLLLLFTLLPTTRAQNSGLVRISSLWRTPGLPSFSPDGNTLFIYSPSENLTRMGSITTGAITAKFSGSVALISQDGRFAVAVNTQNSTSSIIEIATGTFLVQDAAYIPRFFLGNGALLAAQDVASNTTLVINPQDGSTVATLPDGNASFSSNGLSVMITNEAGTRAILNATTGETLFEVPADYETATLNADGSLVIGVDNDTNIVRFLEIPSGTVRLELTGAPILQGQPASAAIQDSAAVFYDAEAGVTRLVNPQTGALVSEIEGQVQNINADGTLIFVTGANSTLVIDTVAGNTLVEISEVYRGGSFATTANNTLMTAISAGTNELHLIDLPAGTVRTEITGLPIYTDDNPITIQLQNNLFIVNDPASGLKMVVDPSTGTLLTDAAALSTSNVASNGTFILLYNGVTTDIYGSPAAKLPWMPVPRVGGGVVLRGLGSQALKQSPNDGAPSSLPGVDGGIVIGKSDTGWLYVSYAGGAGWIPETSLLTADDLDDWDDAPVIGDADVVGTLLAASETQP